ncbi:MAG: PqqD family protein [Cyanobacteriota bacterium SKYGB_h_bin112]|nr:PqqD family protein [Cyanobacteriota bacterium SKYGB_h_bin112]
MVISFAGRVKIPSDVLIRELDGESVLLNLDSETYFGLDDVGTRMILCLSNAASIQAAYDQLLEEYDVDPETLRDDLQTLIEELQAHGLVEVISA